MKKIIALLAVVAFVTGCKKEEEDPVAPAIVYSGISATSVQQFDNEVTVSFTYEDYQGDLGHQDPDIVSLRVKDARLSDADMYHVPPMTPDLEELHIKGTYSVNLNTLFLLGNGASESTKFYIQIQDRAGNWSNEIITPEVVINP
jgi:hypothetical protein